MKYAILTMYLVLSLPACTGQAGESIPQGGVYRPPTQPSTSLPTVPTVDGDIAATEAAEVRPSPTPSCTNGLWFLSDVTIPDGTEVQPGENLDKRWEVKNSGTCNWDDGYQVRLIAGPGMGVPVQQALVPALSGTITMIRMVFIAPEEPGNHRSAWQAYDPLGNAFGDPFFIDVVVQAPEEMITTTTEGPTPTAEEGER